MAAIESQLIDAGITPLAGVDEAGRGACAGPLVIASVILHDPFAEDLAAVRDSKDVRSIQPSPPVQAFASFAGSLPANEKRHCFFARSSST